MLGFSKRTDYALMALSCLAAEEEGEATNSRTIASRYGIPPELLAKTMQLLARGGIVDSRNGPKGGYVLARPPESVIGPCGSEPVGQVEAGSEQAAPQEIGHGRVDRLTPTFAAT